jgi:hypothetical protein
VGLYAVFRTHDILVWIRIRIRGSMPLTNGTRSGSRAGSGSIPLTSGSGSGSGGSKNTWIPWIWIRIRIRIRNTDLYACCAVRGCCADLRLLQARGGRRRGGHGPHLCGARGRFSVPEPDSEPTRRDRNFLP